MKEEALTIADNLLAEILIMCAAQRDSKAITHDLIFKLNELLIQTEPIFREAKHNKKELGEYRAELTRVFNGYLKGIDSLFPDHQVIAAELTCGPDGFNIHQDYTVADLQQFLHDVFLYVDSKIDKEFPAQGVDIALPELNSINEKLLLLKHTGVYEQIKTVCGNNKKRMSELIGAITGQNAKAIQVTLNYIDTPYVVNKNNPFSSQAINKVMVTLLQLNIDTTDLQEILLRLNK
jgi:hypothetical protein